MSTSFLMDVRPLRASAAYRALMAGQAVSYLGNRISTTAVPIEAYAITHSPLAVGGLSAAALGPLLIFGLAGGTIADAMDRRKLLLVTEVGRWLVAALFLLNALAPHPSVAVLYLLTAIGTSCYSLGRPSLSAMIPRLVGDELLPAAQALNMTMYSVATVVGPAVAGLLVAAVGFPATFAIGVVTFAASVWGITRLPALAPEARTERAGLRSLLEGLRFVRSQPSLLGIFLADTNAMVFGMSEAIFPAMADVLGGGARTIGLLYAAPSFGALVMAALSGWTGRIRRQGRAVNVAVALWGLAIIGFGLAHQLWLALLCLAIAGGADAVSAIFRSTILLQATPDELRGRVSGVEWAQVSAAPSLGDVEAGVVATLASVRAAVVSGGLACIAGIGLLALFLPALDRYIAPAGPSAEAIVAAEAELALASQING